MASRAESVQIGPFVGGLNLYSDNSSIADNELVECLNFELDLDGSLVSRPPIYDLETPFTLDSTGNIQLLGYYTSTAGTRYLLASDGDSSTYYYTGVSWTLVTNTIAASAMVQFDNKAWLLAPVGSANPGGYWEPSGGFVADNDMPKGEVMVAYKFRLWVGAGKEATSNGTRLWFSELLGDTPFWDSAFVDIGAGDGQNIVGLEVYFNSIVIFRTDSVYTLTYNSDPSAAQVVLILAGTGLTDKDCIVTYENYIYFMYEDRAYEFYNNRAQQINMKVPFSAVSTSGIYKPLAVSVFNNRIVFSYYDTLYVYGLRTKTWTRWRSEIHGPIGKILETAAGGFSAVTHSTLFVGAESPRKATVLGINDSFGQASEDMTCIAQTKNYDYQSASTYKKLFWWGINTVMRGEVKGVVTPITFNFSNTWGQLLSTTWGQLNTWGQPTSEASAISKVIDLVGSGSMRKFIKFPKTLRFRQANFRVEFKTDGSSSTAPVRLFSLMTRVRSKQIVAKQTT